MLNRPLRPPACSLLVAALALGLAGCAARHSPKTTAATPLAPPPLTAPYAAASCAGSRVYRLAGGDSRVLVLVGKAGVLAGAGHTHVIAIERLRGFAEIGARGAQADLVFPLRAMRVDPPAIRSALGGEYADTRISAGQRAGTRSHMLGASSLDARDYPRVHLAITRPGTTPGAATTLQIRITLHGHTRAIRVPARIQISASALVASGGFDIRQSAFGIVPYSLLLGALRVKDSLRIRYHLVFYRWPPPGTNPCSTPP